MNALNSIWSDLKSDPIKSVTALAAIGGLIIGWINLKKDSIRIAVVVRRAQSGPLILQHPRDEFLLFEVYNQGISPVVINEVGIKIPRRPLGKARFINLVDLPNSQLIIKGREGSIGTREYVGIPGTIPARSMGIFVLCYSDLRESFNNCQKQSISSTDLNFVGSQTVIKIFQEFQSLEASQGQFLHITPYASTGAGKRFVGRKAIIRLGILGEAIA